MSKSIFFTGQPIFSQLLSYIPHSRVNQIAGKFQTDHYYKSFKTYEHLVTILYGIFNRCSSLREVVTGLQAWEHRIHHLGITSHPRKSTISDANIKRQSAVFEAIFNDIYLRNRHFLPDSRKPKQSSRLFIADSTTISLFQEVLRSAGCHPAEGKRKGGIKVHTLMKSDEDVPRLVRFTAGAAADSPFLDHIKLPPGSILVVDRGYRNYRQWNRMTKEKITWISRLREYSTFRITKECPVSGEHKIKGVRKDCWIEMGHTHSNKSIKVKARLVTYYDADSKKEFQFLTNNRKFAPTTIAGLYRKRWQIELLFKRIKQNYPLRNFLGEGENAIRIQIWCALIADLIIKLVQSRTKRIWAFSHLTSMIRLHLMTYIELFSFLKNPEKALWTKIKPSYQMSLFPT